MSLKLVSIDSDGVVRITAPEQMTASDLDTTGEDPMLVVVGQDWASHRVLLSLDQTNYIDSSALGWLLTCQKEFASSGGRLVLHSITPGVQEVLDVMRIGSILPIAEDEPAGLKLLRSRNKS